MDIANYIRPELLILIPVLYLLGYFIKKSNVKDERIPLILVISGVFLAILWIMSQDSLVTSQAWGSAIFAGITQGILVAGGAVLGNQLIVQGMKETNNIIMQSTATVIDPPDTTTTTEVTVEKEEPPKSS
jgi:hypothetical protein